MPRGAVPAGATYGRARCTSVSTYETQKVEGHWRHSGLLYRDDLVRVVVDVPDSARNRDG
jgi:hypothetical protein